MNWGSGCRIGVFAAQWLEDVEDDTPGRTAVMFQVGLGLKTPSRVAVGGLIMDGKSAVAVSAQPA